MKHNKLSVVKAACHGEIQALRHFLRLTFLRKITKARKCHKYTFLNSKDGGKNIQ